MMLLVHQTERIKMIQKHHCAASVCDACRDSVCDGAGECWEVSSLYIADASTFPTASGVNPMITAQSIAYMVATGIAARTKRACTAAR